jgi:hypothetical protein
MCPDGEQTLRHRKVAVAQRTVHEGIDGQGGTQFPPQGDALQEGAGPVHSGQAKRQSGVHVEMRVDERRGDEATRGVDFGVRLGVNAMRDGGDLGARDGDVDALLAVRQVGLADDQIEHVRSLWSG